MARKNNKKKLKKRHQQNLERQKKITERIVNTIKDVQERAQEEKNLKQSRADMLEEKQDREGQMAVEGVRKKIKKKRQFKIFQKRLLKEAKRRRKQMRKAPLIVNESRKMRMET